MMQEYLREVDLWLDRVGAGSPEMIYLDDDSYNDEYINRCGISRLTTLDECKELLMWGSYGRNREHYPNLVWRRLKDCDDDHLINILKTQKHVNVYIAEVIRSILNDRGYDTLHFS